MKWITLTDYAYSHHLSYNAALRLVLVGEVRAERRGTRWFVADLVSVPVHRDRGETRTKGAA